MTFELNTSTSRPRFVSVLRSIGAVVAGFLTIGILSVIADQALAAVGLDPSTAAPELAPALYAVALAYRAVFGILAGYVAARLAPHRPMTHALILGAIGTVLSIGGAIAMWGVGPIWYPLALIAISLPTTWAGARLHKAS